MDCNLIYSGVKKRANQALKRLKGFLSGMTVTKDTTVVVPPYPLLDWRVSHSGRLRNCIDMTSKFVRWKSS